MKYKVFQIQLTEQEYNDANDGVVFEKFVLQRQLALRSKVVGAAKKAFDLGYYDHVMTVDAKNLEDVYAVGNFMNERDLDKVEVHGQFSSVSVGDVIVDENDFAFVVDMFGFEMLPEKVAA